MKDFKVLVNDPSKATHDNHAHNEQFIVKHCNTKEEVEAFFKTTEEYKNILTHYKNEEDVILMVVDGV